MPNPVVHWEIQTEQPPGLLEVPLGDDGRVCVLDPHGGGAPSLPLAPQTSFRGF